MIGKVLGTFKMIIGFLVFIVAIVASTIPLMDNRYSIEAFILSLLSSLYAFYLFYSGKTQRKGSKIGEPIILWFGILYGIVGIGTSLTIFFERKLMWSSIGWGVIVAIITTNDIIRVLNKPATTSKSK